MQKLKEKSVDVLVSLLDTCASRKQKIVPLAFEMSDSGAKGSEKGR